MSRPVAGLLFGIVFHPTIARREGENCQLTVKNFVRPPQKPALIKKAGEGKNHIFNQIIFFPAHYDRLVEKSPLIEPEKLRRDAIARLGWLIVVREAFNKTFTEQDIILPIP